MSYEVVQSRALDEQLKRLAEEAGAHGQGDDFTRAWDEMTLALEADPLGPGELKYHSPSGVPVFSLGRGPIVITFAVYVGHRKVWITKVERLLAPGE
jgi:hypothetical protein